MTSYEAITALSLLMLGKNVDRHGQHVFAEEHVAYQLYAQRQQCTYGYVDATFPIRKYSPADSASLLMLGMTRKVLSPKIASVGVLGLAQMTDSGDVSGPVLVASERKLQQGCILPS